MEDKLCLIASPFYGRTNKEMRRKELKDLKENNRMRHINFQSLHEISDFYYTVELKHCEEILDRLMLSIALADYILLDIHNADTTTAMIIAAIDRINITRDKESKIQIIAYAEDERIYDNDLYELIYTPVSFDQFLIGAIQKNGAVYRTFLLAESALKKISKELRIKRRQEEREKEKAEKAERAKKLEEEKGKDNE